MGLKWKLWEPLSAIMMLPSTAWSMLCTGAGDKEKDELLSRIVDLWFTIRGFSFARSWMEMFKQANRRGTHRAKALRKYLLL